MIRRAGFLIASLGVVFALVDCGGSADSSLSDLACSSGSQCVSDRCESGRCVGEPSGTTPSGAVNGAAPGTSGTPGTPGIGEDAEPPAACQGAQCAPTQSCARARGGKTCGPSGNDDCCAVVTQGKHKIDKYLVTAGRMRTFVERFQGNIQGYVSSLGPEKWKPAWNEQGSLPTDIASANELLGPYGNKKSCNNGQYTGHTYWTPKNADDFSDFDQDTLDDKALNCVPWSLLQALCVWDGGRLATLEELRAAFTNGGTTKYPWGDESLSDLNAPDPKNRLNMEGSFATTPLPATYRKSPEGTPYEAAFRISPPGRYPAGNNKAGIADSAGNLLEWVGDRPRQFVWKADFEHHAAYAAGFNLGKWWWEKWTFEPWVWGTNQLFFNAGMSEQKNGYYAIGGRCAR